MSHADPQRHQYLVYPKDPHPAPTAHISKKKEREWTLLYDKAATKQTPYATLDRPSIPMGRTARTMGRRRILFVFSSLALASLSSTTRTSASMNPAPRQSDKQAIDHAASTVGVRPLSSAPRILKRIAWRVETALLRCVSFFGMPDSKLSLRVLWWKAILGNCKSSPVFDGGLAYDMLPGCVRVLVSPMCSPWYPRWTHVIVEIRTAYLDTAVRNIIQTVKSRDSTKKIRLITMGGGYDTRSIKMQELLDEAIELDLPEVVQAKKEVLQRLQRRRPECKLPHLYALDLQRLDEVSKLLENILEKESSWHTIFLFEGVLMYLDEGVPLRLLEVCRRAVDRNTAHVCFADLLLRETDARNEGEDELSHVGWKLTDWVVKGGRARHMGVAESIH